MSDLLADAAKLVAAADLLRRSADTMHDRRLRALDAGELNARQFRKNVVDENALRAQVGEILLAARKKAVDGADGAQADLEGAIGDADATIREIADVRHALKVFASLIGLAAAIAALKPLPIVEALVALRGSLATTA